jgi:N utilization substance protein A
MEALDVDEMVAQLLTSEGLVSVEEVAYVPTRELVAIDAFDEETATELQERARDYLERQNQVYDQKRRELGVEDAVAEVPGLTPAMLVALGENGVRTLDDLADLAVDELIGGTTVAEGERVTTKGVLQDFDLDLEEAERIIMAARAHWFDDEDSLVDDAAADTGEIEDGVGQAL